MAKFTHRQKLSPKEETSLIIEFCKIVAVLSNTEEAILFIRDLLSKQEVKMLAKRLKIARYLIEGKTYHDISVLLKVSSGTIARVNGWLNQAGEGYRLAIAKVGEVEEPQKPFWTGLKRKYPMYYWPEILLKEIIYSASKRQRERLQKIINSLDSKDEMIKEIDVALRERYRPR